MVAGCQTTMTPETPRITGRALLWHGWSDGEADFLEQLVDNFSAINPETRIITIAVPQGELLAQYQASTAQGIGPDLVIGSSDWVRPLVDAGYIRPIQDDAISLDDYRSNTIAALRYQDEMWGYPMALEPVALYYNKDLVTTVPRTLDDLLLDVNEEKSIAFVPRFEEAHWGVQTFGDGLFDEDGNFTLATSGFREWLTWLNEAQSNAGVILNRDGTTLQRLFIEGKIAYYVAKPTELTTIVEAMGEDVLGVTWLPAGPEGASGPLLPVETMMLSTASTKSQAELAITLARYLTNTEQTRTLMRTLNRVPANRQVLVDSRVHPLISGFSQQARTAVTLPNDLDRQDLYTVGDLTYGNVLSGVKTPEEAVCDFGLAVIELQGYGPESYELPPGCSVESPNE